MSFLTGQAWHTKFRLTTKSTVEKENNKFVREPRAGSTTRIKTEARLTSISEISFPKEPRFHFLVDTERRAPKEGRENSNSPGPHVADRGKTSRYRG